MDAAPAAELNRISLSDHIELVRYIQQGDVEGAQAILHIHIEETTANHLARVVAPDSDAVLAPLSVELPPRISDDMETPRRLGAFVMALDPAAFSGADVFRSVVARYVDSVRHSRALLKARVLATGDREWEEEARRRVEGSGSTARPSTR